MASSPMVTLTLVRWRMVARTCAFSRIISSSISRGVSIHRRRRPSCIRHRLVSIYQATLLMSSDWWPSQLAHLPMEDPWGSEYVVVAEIKSFDEAPHVGHRRTFSALVPINEIDEVTKNLAKIEQSVSTTGPHPLPHGDYVYKPEFWIEARDLPSQRYEPVVLSWSSHDRTVLLPEPGFLMTYGLMPRPLGNGFVSWDDPASPVQDVVKVSPPSTYKFPTVTTADILIRKDYLQDYLALRHMALIQVYWE